MDGIVYDRGYEDAANGRPLKLSNNPAKRLSYLTGYRQQLLDYAEAIESEINRTKEKGE